MKRQQTLTAFPAPLMAIIQQEEPTSVLYIADHPVAQPDNQAKLDWVFSPLPQFLSDPEFSRFDLVFIAQQASSVTTEQLTQCIAKCRDLVANKILVENQVTQAPDLSENNFLALGFKHCALLEPEPQQLRTYYYYDLKTYKPVPDWLNPKFWANPENWDKYRW